MAKQGDALSPLFSTFALEYAIKRIQVNQEGLILNGAHQLIIYVDDAYILAGSTHAVKKNRDTFLVSSRKIGVDVNAEKSK